ncbi:MAG: T9SS type A sorting domain-containing protein [Bacteroidetes bacterium]|nr:T9SS type A sorting domain-containing protein [Bacteroidota bacterium]
MKKLIFLALLSMLFTCTRAQSPYQYVPFPDSSAVWTLNDDCTFYDSPEGDHIWTRMGEYLQGISHDSSLPNIYTYRLLTKKWIRYDDYLSYQIMGDSSALGFIREDTLARKIYFRDLHANEYLLYDFSKGIGDTLDFVFCETCDVMSSNHRVIINHIDTIVYGGIPRKVYSYYPIDTAGHPIQAQTFQIIEGIGSTAGLLNPIAAWISHPDACGGALTCFSQNDTSIYPSFSVGRCPVALPYQIDIHDINLMKITIYPSPATDQLHISYPDIQAETTIALHDIMGREVWAQPITKAQSGYSIAALPSGVYLYQVRDRRGTIASGRIIKE